METPLQITYHGMETSLSLDAMIGERVDRMERLHGRITSCRVVVDVPHRAAETAKVSITVKVEVLVPGRPVIVGSGEVFKKEAKADVPAAVTEAFDAVERQLGKPMSHARPETSPHASTGETGQVVRLFPEQRYGFIEVAGGPDLYFTENAVADGAYDELEAGMIVLVTRATTEGPMGPQASSVRLLNKRKSAD